MFSFMVLLCVWSSLTFLFVCWVKRLSSSGCACALRTSALHLTVHFCAPARFSVLFREEIGHKNVYAASIYTNVYPSDVKFETAFSFLLFHFRREWNNQIKIETLVSHAYHRWMKNMHTQAVLAYFIKYLNTALCARVLRDDTVREYAGDEPPFRIC